MEPDPRAGVDADQQPLGTLSHVDARRGLGNRGAASTLALVLVTPVAVTLAFAAFQAAMWSHARTEARVIARDTAALVARGGLVVEDARASAVAALGDVSLLRDVEVDVGIVDGSAVVTVAADAPGIIRGTRAPVRVVAAVPLEGWVP